jgi:F subunit of K+-transporting ATPase (Potass_KdpF)
LVCSSGWSRLATGFDGVERKLTVMLILCSVLTVAALLYLGYAMIRPEVF